MTHPCGMKQVLRLLKTLLLMYFLHSIKDMGKVMGVAKSKIGSRAEGRVINQIAKEL
ncbi:MAG TPA: GatB/YqeY domain-containing protein, partial [bacterium (Candidatus Stahlbacteria)]|nr:GatB/YqeY domain-containing protein [Candidatus Stahlbacteria bacterium]